MAKAKHFFHFQSSARRAKISAKIFGLKGFAITVLIVVHGICWNEFFAQREFNRWYFGNGAGLDFSTGKPRALTDGKLFTEEGCASVADANGDLLFYTNGITVWDRHHNVMPNGTGLAGGISSTQSALIIPFPGSNNKYYIFTVAEKAEPSGLSYSVVDLLAGSDKKLLTKNQQILLTPDILLAAAKPDVILKNIRLLSPVSEKLTAIANHSGDGFWIITHQWNSNAYYAFPVTTSGIGKPVVSKIGSTHRETGAGQNREAIGWLVASPDGKKLCSAICYKANNDIELFDFDKASGIISNLISISTKGYGYGMAFSSDNSKLYVSFLKGDAGIIQYDMGSKDIFASAVVIAGNKIENIVFGALQTGPDNKIYIAKTGEYLDVIHKPNVKGMHCGYEEDGVFLGGRYSVYGLPSPVVVPSVVPVILTSASAKENIQAEKNCIGKLPFVPLPKDTELYCKSELVLDAGNEGGQFLWSTRETTRKITVKESGIYHVTVTVKGCSTSVKTTVEFTEKISQFSYLPEFKPSNAMLNNAFQFSINDVKDFEMKVYSKKNKLVFESKDSRKFWNGRDEKGKEYPPGDYKWIVKYISKCGNSGTVVKEGTVKIKK